MLLLRRTCPELLENHIKTLMVETVDYAKYRDSDKTLTFVTGSTLKFGYCDAESDVLQYQGQEYDVIFMDEATQFTEYQFDCIKTCLRGANDFIKRFYLTCNPGGVGHGWVKRLFLDRQYRDGERPEDYTFIQSRVYDNAALLEKDPDYLRTLQALSPELRKAWLDGDWDIFAGQYFTEFRREKHVMEPIEIPSHWTRVIACDYGLDMLAVVWGAFDTFGNGYIYKELCKSNLPVAEAAAEILALCTPEDYGGRPQLTVVAPPDLWSRTKDSGKSVAELFLENGIMFQRGDNNRQNGWMNIKAWLADVKQPDGGEAPRLRIFANCTELIRCLPLLQYDSKNSMDCANEPHDITHSPDSLRYLLQSRPRVAREPDTRTAEEKMLAAYKEAAFGHRQSRTKIIRGY